MQESLSKGGNMPWLDPRAEVKMTGLPAGGSVLAFLVTATGKVRSDDDFVFFNNPAVAGVEVIGHGATIELDRIPADIERVVIAAVQDDEDQAPLSARPLQVTVDPGGLRVPVTGLSTERAVVLIEMYRRAQQWKVRSVSAGWTEGFSALVRAHGVVVDDEGDASDAGPAAASAPVDSTATPTAPVSSVPPAATGPKLNLVKPGIDAFDLGKRSGAINLRKGEQVTITKTARIVATCTWPRATD